jgi:hypothetical protein
MTASDELWLTGPDAEPYLADAAATVDDQLALASRLRKVLSAERARLVVEQAILRRRARDKFSLADRLFFTAVGLEQATDEATARYKAACFRDAGHVIDFCCGIGGDLLALGWCGSAVGIDRDEVTVIRAAANCRVMRTLVGDAFQASVEQATVEAAMPQLSRAAECRAWHIDPDRRPAGRRTTRVELHEPGLDVLNAMLALNVNGAVKLAPAAEVPEAWRESAECEWLGRRGECKQLVAWFGDLARSPGMRRATVIADDGRARSITGRGDAPVSDVAQLGRYLFEPDSAVLAAGLVGELATEYQIAAVHPGSVYLTGDAPHLDPLLATLEIIESLPFDQKRLRAWLAERGIGRLEIKKRGVEIDVERLRRDLQLSGNEAATLILARRGDRVTAIVANRIRA